MTIKQNEDISSFLMQSNHQSQANVEYSIHIKFLEEFPFKIERISENVV